MVSRRQAGLARRLRVPPGAAATGQPRQIRLRSANPADRVRITQNFLSDERDLPVLRAGLKLLREVASQPALDAFRGREVGPGAGMTSDADLDAYIRSSGATAHHPCGTCRMGGGPDAVVDAALRVHGVNSLRVADASVMPDLVGGNINATVIAITEKAADLIQGKPAADTPAPAPHFGR